MSIYVTLYKFTDQGIRNVKDSPARLEAGIKSAEAAGIKVLGAYYTLGEYDLVVISETDDEEAGIAHTLAQNAMGNVRSITLRGLTPEQFAAILAKTP